jgi:KDO2-lipid IV(A) lauroyltransferase
LVKALHRGEITGILPDQHPPASGGRLAPLLGIETRTMTLIYKLLKKSDAQAIMASALRVSGGWTLHFTQVSNEIYSDDEATSLAALNKGVEDIIALAPDQYQWEYNRFREIPLGESIHD